MFNLGINESRATKGFYNKTGDYIKVPPMGVFDFSLCSMPSSFTPIKNFLDTMRNRNHQRFYIQRSFALGDVLTTVPAVRLLREAGWDATMRVADYHAPLMDLLQVPYTTTKSEVSTPGLITDWIYERDLTDPRLGGLNRAVTAMKAIGIEPPDEIEWTMDAERLPELPMKTEQPYVVMTGWGSGVRKRLPVATIERTLRALNEDGIAVYYNGNPTKLNTGPMTTHLERRLSATQLFTLIYHAAALVTVDSGPLWVAHYTATPTVAILGPSHWRQRLAAHPLWPEGAEAIQMNEWMNCPSCSESAARCGGTYACLLGDAERLAREVTEKVIRYKEQVNGD